MFPKVPLQGAGPSYHGFQIVPIVCPRSNVHSLIRAYLSDSYARVPT